MNSKFIKTVNWLEEEIARKRAELKSLEAELAQVELERLTLESKLAYFQRQYLSTVGVRLAELDEIRAQIAEAIAKLNPQSESAQEEANRARTQAEETSEEAASFTEDNDSGDKQEFTPSDSLKKLYREVARKIHPDVAINEEERAKRNEYMATANQAYRDGDEKRLREILADWDNNAGVVHDREHESELESINRAILHVKKILKELHDQINEIESSEIGQLKRKADAMRRDGRDLLSEISTEVDAQLNEARRRILRAVELLTLPF